MASQPSDLATRGARNYWLHLSPSKVKCSQSVYRHRSVAEALRVHVGGDDMFIFSPYFVSSPPLASSPLGRNNTSPFSFFQVSAVTFKWRLIPGECCRQIPEASNWGYQPRLLRRRNSCSLLFRLCWPALFTMLYAFIAC